MWKSSNPDAWKPSSTEVVLADPRKWFAQGLTPPSLVLGQSGHGASAPRAQDERTSEGE